MTQAIESLEHVVPFETDDKMTAMIRSLRQRGADDDTVRLCMGMSRLESIIDANRDCKKHVVVFSFPKSGTTYLHRLLLKCTGFVDYLLDHCSEDQQQCIVQQWAPMFLSQNTVSQIHAFATAPNLRMIEKLGIRPVVMVRNLFDVLVSLRDHILKEDHVIPVAQVPTAFHAWSEQDQFWFLVKMATPWYLNSFVSWQRASQQMNVLWVTYEELIADAQETVKRVLDHSNVQLEVNRLRQVIENIDPNTTRFNVGISGRGRLKLSGEQQAEIRAVAAVYKDTCVFSLIGL
jgi:hypothetical protein